MKKTKEAKFFCESCGSEVRKNDKTCPICGKFFAAVKCPKCGRTGSTEEFATGCPTCGYAVQPDFTGTGKKNNLFSKNNGKKFNNNQNKINDLSLFKNQNKKNKYNSDSSLPIWVYIFLIIVLILLVIMLYSCLLK